MGAIIALFVFSLKSTSIRGLCSECWCLSDDGPLGECPQPENQLFPLSALDSGLAVSASEKFKTFSFDLTPPEEVPRLIPVNGEISSEGPSCNPFQSSAVNIFLPQCEMPYGVVKATSESVCGFFYDEDAGFSCSNRSYGMKTYSSVQEANDDNAVVTHYGPCGVCL